MDIWDSLAMLLRRWYAVVPVLLVAALGACYVVLFMPPSFEARGQVVLLPPTTASTAEASSNPYLAFGSSLDITAGVVAESLMSDQTVESLSQVGLRSTYEVGLSSAGNGPVLNVIVTDSNADAAETMLRTLFTRIDQVLVERQAQALAPKGTQITASVVAFTPTPHRLIKSKVRALAALAVLALSGGVLAGSLAEAVATRRRGRVRRGTHEPAASLDMPAREMLTSDEAQGSGERSSRSAVRAGAGPSADPS